MARSAKILLVDDEKNIRFLLSEVLTHEGFDVTEAEDGQESLEKMETANFDLVITDIHMPRMDGISMLHHMEMAGRKEKVIIMTAKPSEQVLSCGKMPRVITQIYKPFRIENFLELVITATAGNEYISEINPNAVKEAQEKGLSLLP